MEAEDQDHGYNGDLVFVISNGDQDSVFQINMTTGVVSIMSGLDREKTQDYMLNITACDQGADQKCTSILSHVIVLDQNDNPPVFMKSAFSFFFPENTRNGTPVVTLNATDLDSSIYGKVTYILETQTEDFSLNPRTGMLVVSKELDRETREFYDLTIRAVDGDIDKPLSAYANVRVRILDVNDVAPIFTSKEYFVKAREDLPVGSVVGFVDASDPDLYQGGQISFSIEGQDRRGGRGDTFYIDQRSGAVKIRKELDYESKQLYNLTILAVDGGSPSLVSVASFIIEILDVNENIHPPIFDSFYTAAAVPENMPVGSLVTKVSAKDFDKADSDDSRISYSIRAGDGLNSFSIDDTGSIKTSVVLDRENKKYYWLTVYAQDHGASPLFSKMEIFIEVLNVNDNVPLTLFPAYFPSIMENSKPSTPIVTLEAFDGDSDMHQQLVYEIISGDPQSLFSVNPTTGQIVTTQRKLDRETQAEHILDVRVSDSGQPSLNSTTQVIVTVIDQNDNAPTFLERYYKIKIPETIIDRDESIQKDQENLNGLEGLSAESYDAKLDAMFENASWEVFDSLNMGGKSVFRVIAFDKDQGSNAELSYSINNGLTSGKFRINPDTGMVHTTTSLLQGEKYDLLVKATDGGQTPQSGVARVSIEVARKSSRESKHSPRIEALQPVEVLETDPVGHLVTLLVGEDEDGDQLFYDIVEGDSNSDFSVSRDKGSLIIARGLDWDRQAQYNLTISLTDGSDTIFTSLTVTVIKVSERRPEFSSPEFSVQIPENSSLGRQIVVLNVTNSTRARKLFYSLHTAQNPSSLQTFKINPLDGAITLRQKLDRENTAQHIITVSVKDTGSPSKKNFARLVIDVVDHNDHAPQFLSQLIQTKLFETAVVGSSVVQAFAVDLDHGDNGRIVYSILSGNLGNSFSIDPQLGLVRVARQLDMTVQSEFMLILKATDGGQMPLTATVPVHIMLTMADSAPPRFVSSHYATELYENTALGHSVIQLEARSQSSLTYEITGGNQEGMFQINPSTGVIMTKQYLDFEVTTFYNLSVSVSNMVAAKSQTNLDIHILDVNDNPPKFEKNFFVGNISETAGPGSLVLVNNTAPLVIKATDQDSGLNSLLLYEILEEHAKRYFSIDPSTGAIRTTLGLDYESQTYFEFNVRVSDMGQPRLSAESMARVKIYITDENDSPPQFGRREYKQVLLLPTFTNVTVISVTAEDPDRDVSSALEFSISAGNQRGLFDIHPQTGRLAVRLPRQIQPNTKHSLQLRVSDGKFTDVCKLNIAVRKSDNSGLAFSKSKYYTTVLENSTKADVILVVNVLGSALNEILEFRLLNPSDMFSIGKTSGALRTTGQVFDREKKEHYELIVEVRSQERQRSVPRIAHVVVDVDVLDLNDNPPVFVNKPYSAIVSKQAAVNSKVIQVMAVDADKGSNADIYYQLVRGNGELFRVERKSGVISLRRGLDSYRKDYILTIAAYDGGSPPYSAEIPVQIKVVDKSVPTFSQQSFEASLSENTETFSAVVSTPAESPSSDGKIIYTIQSGNEEELFSIDYNGGVVYVVQSLDYETKQHHQLTLRATDSKGGGYSEAILLLHVLDVNDCSPVFLQESYNIEVSEALPSGSVILQVEARDQDSGVNQELEYSIMPDHGNYSDMFSINSVTGEIELQRGLDHERQTSHHLSVVATDKGPNPRTGLAHVWVSVLDSNDNPPEFEDAEYEFHLSDRAKRGQFVGKIRALDLDISDHEKIRYSIIGGNEHQIFSIEETSGIIRLVNLHNFDSVSAYLLNVTVTDGVYSTSTKVRIALDSVNTHNPEFVKSLFEVKFRENQPAGSLITRVVAQDGDGDALLYTIQSDHLSTVFQLSPLTGELRSQTVLDREDRQSYEIPITVTDQGGRNGFATIKISLADENDNSPYFPVSEYKANIPANLTVGSNVLKVTAEDKDKGKNAAVKYEIYETENSGVADIFLINDRTGQILLRKSSSDLENEVYQFFVRAIDNARDALYADVPVEIMFISSLDSPPKFAEHEQFLAVSESSPVGQTVARLTASPGHGQEGTKITYRLASTQYLGEEALFQIDDDGRVIISGRLDRETEPLHKLHILAETETSPALISTSQLTVHVMDENDHPPVFQSSQYEVRVVENVPPHTQILQVLATDQDIANNGEISYSFSDESRKLAHLFSIDPHHGWITTLGELDYEEQQSYTLTVLAQDNGRTVLSSSATVNIRLQDFNDNPPQFSQRVYSAAVNEGALPGTIIFQLQVTDEDKDVVNPVEFFITGGDSLAQFQIKENGELYVARALDRERKAQYRMEIRATDGVFVSQCRVTLEILDDNDSPPYCTRYFYREEVAESLLPGSPVLTVTARDADEGRNAEAIFSLSGASQEMFSIDDQTGELSTAVMLDRETQDSHLLQVHVQDAGRREWECVSVVELRVTDTNDNRPMWDHEEFLTSMTEDSAVGSIVTKVHAIDLDLGENRKISYSLLSSDSEHFTIDSSTGIVSLSSSLDRERRDVFNLTVRAMDSGRPRLSAVTNLVVRVVDVNDNPPQFASKYYFASISEGVDLGTDVVRVMATSRDIGVNAEISYTIIAGNEHRKFGIETETGLVSVTGKLDFERAKEYFLTIQAQDGGTPPLSNHATVNISIMDVNDNVPIFTQLSYGASVNENSLVGSSIITLTATDLDQGQNGQILYEIVHGDQQNQFTIDQTSGLVSVGKTLDREMIASYVLEVQAVDQGSASLSASVLVNINIQDTNDNPPIFPQGNYTVYVQEDKPYGHILLRFSVTDSDDSPNGAPFTWDIRSGNEESAFRIVQDGSLRTAKKFNHKVREQYVLQIRVFDNGTPPLYSDSYVTVNIIEESQYPPVITPLDIEVFSYQDDFPGSIVGKIKASDQDPYDVLGYELLPSYSAINLPPSVHLFEIDRRDGTIVALQGLDVGVYSLNVSVSDGKFTSHHNARVAVNLVTDKVLQNAVIVQFAKITPEHFVDSYKTSFVKIMKNLFNVRSKDVEILGVQLTYGSGGKGRHAREEKTKIVGETRRQPGVEVLFAIKQEKSIYLSRDEIRASLDTKLSSVAAQIGLKITEVRGDFCQHDSECKNGKCVDVILMSDRQMISVSTDVRSLVFPQFQQDTVCHCKPGFAGPNCQLILNECHREPCPSFRVCVPDSSDQGYSCQCPPGFTGAMCNVNLTSCQDRKCDVINPLQFSGRSYAQYSLKRSLERHLSLSLGFKTRYQAATIMYARGLVDYSILEVVNGKLQYRFNFGSGEGLVTLTDKTVSDGAWYAVQLERHGNSAELSLDGKWRAQGAAPGLNDVLNLEQSDVYFGADVVQATSDNTRTEISRGFVGCMDDIKLDHVSIPLHINGDSQVAKLARFTNIEFKCDSLAEPGACGSQPCQHGGTCLELPTPAGFACTCPARFSGARCEYDLEPCASSPCLHGAKCVNLKNDFHCECPAKLSGKRCHYGKYCNPNPCQNSGVCEEGIDGPICKCRGFTGEFCTIDVNECLHQNPCHNGGTCINSPGGFTCICPGNTTGLYCNDLAHISMLPRKYALTLEEVVGIILSLFIIVIIVALFVVCRKFGSKRSQNRAGGRNLLIQNEFDKEHIMMKPTRNGSNGAQQKLNNLELVAARDQDLPLLSHRPTSVSPTVAETNYNYMDTLRSYGAAAEELETLPRIPHDYIQNIQKPVATVAPSMMSDRDMNLKDNYFKRKMSPGPDSVSSGYYRPSKLTVNLPAEVGEETCQSELSVEDDCQRYHWDCSDWAGQLGQTTSVPEQPVDPSRDIETLAEDEEEQETGDDVKSIVSSECESQLGAVYPDASPMHQTNKSIEELLMANDMNYADDDNGSVDIPNIYDYRLHLNNYLPTYHLGSDQDTDEATPMLGRHPRPFPGSPPAASQDPEAGSRKSSGPLRGLILPPLVTNGQSSDRLCEIEDEDEELVIKRTPSPRVTRV